MAYRCNTCKKYTIDMDEPPCGEDCQTFLPEEVLTIHHAPFDDAGDRILTCTGQESASRVRMTSSPFATTCPQCLEKIYPKPKPTPIPESPVLEEPPALEEPEENLQLPLPEVVAETPEPATLLSIGFFPGQVESVKRYALKNNLPSLITPTGLLAWVNEGNDITIISGIGQRSKEPLLKLLNEGN